MSGFNPLLEKFEKVTNAPKEEPVVGTTVPNVPVTPPSFPIPDATKSPEVATEAPTAPIMPLEVKTNGPNVMGDLRNQATTGPGPTFTPSGVIGDSKYRVKFPEGLSPSQKMLDLQKKKVEDMTQDELREVYLYIGGKPGSHIYSASDLNYAAMTNRLPQEKDHEETDSLFIGDQVHKAMELKGSNLQKIKYYEEVGPPPAQPEFADFTKLHYEVLAAVTQGASLEEGVKLAYNNKATKAVEVAEIREYHKAIEAQDGTYAISKEMTALTKEARKQCGHITGDHVKSWRLHLNNQADYDKKKRLYIQDGDIVLDNLHFRSMGCERMKNTILNTYKSLCENAEVMDVYDTGVGGHGGQLFTEYVVLWQYQADNRLVECKSMFDRYIINPELKKATVSDIKTHSGRSSGFVSGNYHNYGYYRSMSFYKEAVMADLTKRGYNAAEWEINMVLLPASTMYVDLGCHFPTAIISETDLASGKYNGIMKPRGATTYTLDGKVEIFCTGEQFAKYKENLLIHENSREYIRDGWDKILKKLIKTVI